MVRTGNAVVRGIGEPIGPLAGRKADRARSNAVVGDGRHKHVGRNAEQVVKRRGIDAAEVVAERRDLRSVLRHANSAAGEQIGHHFHVHDHKSAIDV